MRGDARTWVNLTCLRCDQPCLISTYDQARGRGKFCSRTCQSTPPVRSHDEIVAYLDVRNMPEPNSGCWLWTGAISSWGYGNATINHRPVSAHRASYMVHVGDIPETLVLDHLCRNRACINPDHLEPVSQQENILRGRAPAILTHLSKQCGRGHPMEGDNLLKNGSRFQCRTCTRMKERQRDRKKRQNRLRWLLDHERLTR